MDTHGRKWFVRRHYFFIVLEIIHKNLWRFFFFFRIGK